eukprot:TRINITY_DN18394_c0_g1_i8.p1 TRINITY_DN18394_c0_g1~~TRINITY_DN18394_c0_g1_i8.p1  ORF type:complete len:318 (-),score=94.55 TRINITY_DN18394_c0_g1_i8:270-1187(-)
MPLTEMDINVNSTGTKSNDADDELATVTSTKKRAAKGDANKNGKKKPVRECVEECNPGPKNPCWQQRKGRRGAGKLSCTEVYDKLQELGMSLQDIKSSSKCALAAIMKGYINVNKEGASLDMVVYEFDGGPNCEHKFTLTLRNVLEQPDNPGPDCDNPGLCCDEFDLGEEQHWEAEEQHWEAEEQPGEAEEQTGEAEEQPGEAEEECEEEEEGLEYGCDQQDNFASRMCEGKNVGLEIGKYHNHCDKCPGFGRCIGDYRNSCYKRNVHTNKIHFLALVCDSSSSSEDDYDDSSASEDDSSDENRA